MTRLREVERNFAHRVADAFHEALRDGLRERAIVPDGHDWNHWHHFQPEGRDR